MSVGKVEHNLSTLMIGGNTLDVRSLFVADTTTVSIVEGDILVAVAGGVSLWNGSDAGALCVAKFAASETATGGDKTFPIEAVIGGDVDATMLRLSGVVTALTDAQKDRLRDHGIKALEVSERVYAGDSNPSEV